jgi:hypothetical protein
MEHLLYVMWHDHWKPWLKAKLETLGYTVVAALATLAAMLGMIWATVEFQRFMDGACGR